MNSRCLRWRTKIYFAMCHTMPTRLLLAHSESTLLDTNEVCKEYRPDFCEALLGMHAFIGNDTISCFAGKGKVKPLTLMQSSAEYIKAFKELGRTWDVPEETVHSKLSYATFMATKRNLWEEPGSGM